MKLVPLTKGQFALVDDSDYEWAMQFRWHASWSKPTRSYYAKRNVVLAEGKHTTFYMHRELLGLERGDKRRGDHEDRNTLNCQRSNLRIATPSQNNMNRRGNHVSISGLKGVSFDKNRRKWVAQLKLNGKNSNLGRFPTRELAAAAYREAAIRHFGEFAFTEKPQGDKAA